MKRPLGCAQCGTDNLDSGRGCGPKCYLYLIGWVNTYWGAEE